MAPTRRRALHLAAGTGAALLAGCLGGGGGTDAEPTTRTTSTTTPTDTATTTSTTTTTEELTTDSDDDTKTETVRIENRSESEQVVSVEVIDSDGTVLIEGTYLVPPNTGLRFENPIEWGTYTVRGKVDGGEWQSMEWEPSSCAATPAPDLNMDAGVVVKRDGSLAIIHNSCDYIKLGDHYVDAYEPAAEHAVEN